MFHMFPCFDLDLIQTLRLLMIQGNNAGESLCAKSENFEQVVVEMEVVFASPYGLGPPVQFRFVFHRRTINRVCIGQRKQRSRHDDLTDLSHPFRVWRD